MGNEVEVFWHLRERAWFARGFSRPEWVRVHGQPPADATDVQLLAGMNWLMSVQMREAQIRRLPPAWRLP